MIACNESINRLITILYEEKVKKMSGFARARVERLIRNAGAFRVSGDAIDRLNEILTEYSTSVAKYAVEIAQHSGRKTVKETDVILAAER